MNHLEDHAPRRRRTPARAAVAAIACGALLMLSCGGGGAGSTGSEGGDVPGTRPARLTLLLEELADGVIAPQYAAMTRAFAALDGAATRFCAAPDASGLETLRGAWRGAIEAWLAASTVQFGPIRDDNRRLRIEFWPDGNNNVSRSVQQVLARTDELTAETLARQSVAAQGLPALEQILFERDTDVLASFTTGDRAARRCAFVTAIAGNLLAIAQAIEAEWSDEDGFARQLAGAGRDSDAFATREAAIEEVVNSLVTSVEVTKNNRIADPLGGETIADAKPFRAESFLSANSLANVAHAIRGLEEAYTGDDEFGFEDYLRSLGRVTLATQIATDLQAVRALAEAIPVSLADAVQSEAERARVVELLDRATTVTRLIKNQLSEAMQVTVGFNENDGD